MLRKIQPPKNNFLCQFNSPVNFSKQQAQLKQLSETVSDGDCLFDTCLQGMRLNEDVRRFDSCTQLRKSSASWAAQNPKAFVGDNFTLFQYLKNHLNKNDFTQEEYVEWWKRVETSKCYAESPVLAALGIYLDYNICVWRRQSKTSHCMKFACLFSSKSNPRQIHTLLDGEADSDLAQDGHFTLITDYNFSSLGSRYGCGKIPMDFRLGTLHKTIPVDLTATEPPQDTIDSTETMQASPPDLDEPELTPTVPDLTLRVRNLRLHCATKGCNRPRSLGQSHCLECEHSTHTQLATPVTTQLDSQPTIQPGAIARSPNRRLFRYGCGHTDGGRRNITVQVKRGKTLHLKDVGGWAFQLLCSHGERYVASASLGPNSTNNKGEFTAILKIVEQAIIAQIDHLDIHTDSNLAVQYFEQTCLRDCPHLIELFERIEHLASAASIQFRLIYVKAHCGNRDNENVDSMCTAAIEANDMVPRYEGPTRIPEFSPPNNFAAPRNSLHPEARYQTLPPYAPFMENDTTPRGVHDLSDDRGVVLHICPFCEIDRPQPLNSRKALLTHLRSQHRDESRTIAPDVLNHFGIERCTECNLHYSAANIRLHSCRPGGDCRRIIPAATRLEIRPPSAPTHFIMTRPNQISDELVDKLTAISYDSIFAFPARTITEIHHASVRMWSSVIALLLDGILEYGFGGVSEPNTASKANAFLKLFLMSPRLILSSTRGVARRARLLLSGTVEAFEKLIQESTPKEIRKNVAVSKEKRQKRTEQRVSKLIQSCDLSRALNALAGSPRLEITEQLLQKVRDLHPSAEEQHRIPQSAPTKINVAPDDRLFSDNDLIRVIKDLRTHAAPDMTGLRPSHIKCIFRGRREAGSPEARSRIFLGRLIHQTMEDPSQLGPNDFWENFAGGKLSVIPQGSKPRPVGQKNILYKIITSILGRTNDKALVDLAGPAHLAGKPSGVLAAAIMAQMELDYSQFVVEDDPDDIRCILTTDARAAFQSASRNNCYKVLCTDDTLRERFAPFFAHAHKGSQRIVWPAANIALKPSSGFTQGDVNSSKLFTCNTASLVQGLQDAGGENATVVAIVDDITIMGTLSALTDVEKSRDTLQLPANYLVNTTKQNVYTMNERHVAKIQLDLPKHNVIYTGNEHGFSLSGIPLGGDEYIVSKLQENLDKTKEVISNICELKNTQEKLILLLQCIPGRIQHLLAAVPTHLSRDFAKQHDEAITKAVAATLDLGELSERDKLLMQRKISQHGLGLRSMEKNLEFLFLAGFMRSIECIKRSFPNLSKALQYTIQGESGYGRQLADALLTLHTLPSTKLRSLLPDTIAHVLLENFVWNHDEIQRELDNLVIQAHDVLYDLSKIPDQQDKATLLSTDTSIFQLIPRSKILQVPNEDLIYLAKQLFGKKQRSYIHKFCPNVAQSSGNCCGALLDSRDLHLRTCKMNNVNHEKHEALKFWFKDLAKQAHIQTAPAPPISEASPRNPTKQLAGDLKLVDVSLRQAGRDGQCGVIDFSIITPAAESYCARAAKEPLYAAKIREDEKIAKYLQAYKDIDDTHFEPFVVESGGQLGEKAQEIFKKICNLITQTTGQSGSSIAYFWKSRLLVTLAKITYSNATRWAMAHNKSKDPDSAPIDLTDCYDDDTREVRRMIHSSGVEKSARGGAEINNNWPITITE